MSGDPESVSVSLPTDLVERLDRLVDDGVFSSRSDALRYGARVVVREERRQRPHERVNNEAREDRAERLERKRVD